MARAGVATAQAQSVPVGATDSDIDAALNNFTNVRREG